ncbi:ABC transporter permease [Arenivirga flava]|uniref:Polyamine ABC transporter permease n=1 Tax=Arenivirga flava TaxID=1930060 RepID=A0AA37UQX9_9MICO|nr:ABC transporter permease [Arenivirga flava]GMA27217.1 polyamine ABC transporter permease [Arenivirga flava]
MTATQAIRTVAQGEHPPLQRSAEERRSRTRQRRTFWLLAAPAILGLFGSFVAPLLYMVRMAFNRGSSDGVIEETFTLDTFARAVEDPYYWKVTLDTFLMGLTVAVLCVIVAYPIALFLMRSQSRFKSVLIALAIAPLLTSAVVRTYGWMVILGGGGLINGTLIDLGLITIPLQLANNFTGVIIGLTEIFMPYAILAMMSGFGKLDPRLEEAAGSLGANRIRTFLKVTLPLSLPGALAAGLLVFVLAISTFVTPRLLGGGAVRVLATEIYDQATGLINWPFAAALSILLLLLFGAMIAGYQALVRKLGIDR